MMELIRLNLVLIVIIHLIACASATTTCDTHIIDKQQCGENEVCYESTNGTDGSKIATCNCTLGYKRVGSDCVPNKTNKKDVPKEDAIAASGGHSTAVGVLVPLILLVAVIVGIYYGWKHQVVGWLRYKINQRYNNNYDDVMLGQDDD